MNKSDFIYGGPDVQQPDWRAYDPDDDIDDNDDPSPISDKMLEEILGFNPDELDDEEYESARFARVGDADDCGHDPDGDFSLENICAGEGGGRSKESSPIHSVINLLDKHILGAKQTGLRSKQKIEKSGRVYRGEMVSHQDKMAAASTPKIKHPQSDEDVDRFIKEVEKTPVYQAVQARTNQIADESPGGDPRLWSIGKHASGDIVGAIKEYKHDAYNHIQWSPDRKKLHDKIINESLNPEAKARPSERPKFAVLIGPPGSGKTTAGQPEIKKLGVQFTTLNSDDIKAKLPEYQGWNASAVHEESALLTEGPIFERAFSENHNIMADLTGGNADKLEAMTDLMHEKGYDIHLVSVSLPAYKSVGRAWDRFTKNAFGFKDPSGEKLELGRFVPPKYVYENIDEKPEKTYRKLKQKPYMKTYVSVSNDVPAGEKPRIIELGAQHDTRRKKKKR